MLIVTLNRRGMTWCWRGTRISSAVCTRSAFQSRRYGSRTLFFTTSEYQILIWQ